VARRAFFAASYALLPGTSAAAVELVVVEFEVEFEFKV
jgi:hypothetical protein